MATIVRGTKSATGTVNFGASTKAKSSEVNTDLNTIVSAINGNLDNDNIASDAAIVATKLNLATIAQNVEFTGDIEFSGTLTGAAILGLLYPVGIVVTLGVSTNPATLFGIGTWTAIEGQVIVGKSSSGTFDTLNATGGAETVTLTSAQSGVPAHTHVQTGTSTPGGSNVSNAVTNADTGASSATSSVTSANAAANAASAHTNLQPYIVKYCWERTA